MYNTMKIDGTQKTLITVIVLFMAFILFLITLPSENVGVYMHNTSHKWAVTDSNGVALEDEDGYTIKETKGYHCVMMERSYGEDNHIESFTNDDFDSAKVLYLELRQLEIDNPEQHSSSSLAWFFLWTFVFILGIAITIGLGVFYPEAVNAVFNYFRKNKQ